MNYLKKIYMFDLSAYFVNPSERLMIDFSGALTGITAAHPSVRILIVRPWFRASPPTYPSDLASIQVIWLVVHLVAYIFNF